MASLDESTEKFQNRMDLMINSIAKKSLPIQKASFECCVKCFDKSDDINRISDCIVQCQKIPQKVTSKIENELQTLQKNIQSCQEVCYNRYSPKFDEAKSSSTQTIAQDGFRQCAAQCYEQFEPHVTEIHERLEGEIKKYL